MASPTTPQNTNDSSSTSSLEDAPLLNLLAKPLQDMSLDELRQHTQELREVSSNPVTLKGRLTNEKQAAKAPAKNNVASAVSKYLNMGQ